MLEPSIAGLIFLYQNHQVLLTPAGGRAVQGYLEQYDPAAGAVVVDGTAYPLSDLEDLKYVGRLTDYRTHQRYGEIDRAYRFPLDGRERDRLDERMCFHEFDCMVSCHLELAEGRIAASDVGLLSCVHVLNEELLSKGEFLYTLSNGTHRVGRLSRQGDGYALEREGQLSVHLPAELVADVTRLPQVNDTLTVVLDDGTERTGLVSAVGERGFNLFGEGGLTEAAFARVRQLRYHGVITAAKEDYFFVDRTYLCKVPYYLRDQNSKVKFAQGMKVSYAVGVNSRSFIAKDVVFQSEGEVSAPAPAPAERVWETGIVITVDMSKENGVGYIGRQFISKSCGTGVRGHVRFQRSQLPFTVDSRTIYVVRYTLKPGKGGLVRDADEIQLLKEYDYQKYPVVTVEEDGQITAKPMFQANPTLYELHDVDVVCLDGSVHSGILVERDADAVVISRGGEEERETIPCDTIDTIRIIGSVSQFYSNGTGWVDNAFFFHINEMRRPAEAKYVHRGALISFVLRNTRKGSGTDCADIVAIPEEKREIYVVGYDGECYTVVDSERYKGGQWAPEDAERIPYRSYNQFRNLDTMDYLAVFTLQRKSGRQECVLIRTIRPTLKRFSGVVTAVDREQGTCTVTREEGSGEERTLPPADPRVLEQFKDLDRWVYPVSYQIVSHDGVEKAAFDPVDPRLRRLRRRRGYLQIYMNAKQYGFITPEEHYGTPIKHVLDNELTCFVHLSTVDEIPERLKPLDTGRYDYLVDYQLGESHDGQKKPPALHMRVLEAVKKGTGKKAVVVPVQPSARAVSTPAPAAPTPAAAPEPEERVETIDLPSAWPEPNDGRTASGYGFLSVYSPKFPVLRVYPFYQNKSRFSEEELRQPEPVEIDQTQTSLQGVDKPSTSKHIYLVRYALDGDKPDCRFPVDILAQYAKKGLKQAELDGTTLTLTRLHHPEGAAAAPAARTEFFPGETLVVEPRQGEAFACAFDSEEDGRLVLEDGRVVDPGRDKVYRFGVFTGANDAFTTGCLNGNAFFDLSAMEAKAFNTVKTSKMRQLLVYQVEGGRISAVERVPSRILALLPWYEGTVTDYVKTPAEQGIWVNGEHIHYRNVLTDGYINNLVRAGQIVDREVYFKAVQCPMYEPDGSVHLQSVAADIHSQQETAAIRYDAVRDSYVAAWNDSRTAPVEGNRSVLAALVDSQTDVVFRPCGDGSALQAYLDEAAQDEPGQEGWIQDEETEQEPETAVLVGSTVLGRLCLSQAELPAEGSQSDRDAFVRLGREKKRSSAVITAMAALAERMPEEQLQGAYRALSWTWTDRGDQADSLLRQALFTRSVEIADDGNGDQAEYSCFLLTLLRCASARRTQEILYRLLLPDFYNRMEMRRELHRIEDARRQRNRGPRRNVCNLSVLLSRPIGPEDVGRLAVHMLSIDERSFEELVERGVFADPDRVKAFLAWGGGVDSAQSFETAGDLMDHLRTLYRGDKRRFTEMLRKGAASSSPVDAAAQTLEYISSRFLRLMLPEEQERFQRLEKCCRDLKNLRRGGFPGFRAYEAALLDSFQTVDELLDGVRSTPTQEAVEMLLDTGILAAVHSELIQSLDALYQDESYLPEILCDVDRVELSPGEDDVIFLVRNSQRGFTNRQSADDLTIHLDVTSGLNDDSLVHDHSLPERRLAAGQEHPASLTVHFNQNDLEGDSFTLAASIEYSYTCGFDGEPKKQQRREEDRFFTFQILRQEASAKDPDAVNYYAIPAHGEALTSSDDDVKMFFGREKEKEEIWNYIVDEDQNLKPGRAIILYGQKKCGKTSLVNQIVKRIQETPATENQAIIIFFSDISANCGGLEHFRLNFYMNILDQFRYALYDRHPDVEELLDAHGLEFPDLLADGCAPAAPALFQRFFREFARLDGGRHRVILVMDEFTRLCTDIVGSLDADPAYKDIPNFIKMLSGMGFIQIVIGHANMVRALSELGIINHTAEFAKRVELTALDEAGARQLVQEPMERSFGKPDRPADIYKSYSGQRAVDRLLELSGRSPRLLMKLCNEMFLYYLRSDRPRILERDVDKMLEEFLRNLDVNEFDMLLSEDGDDIGALNGLATFKYLKYAAQVSYRSNNRDCDVDLQCPELSAEENQEVREVLLERRVISVSNARIHINAGLFVEFIHDRYGAN